MAKECSKCGETADAFVGTVCAECTYRDTRFVVVDSATGVHVREANEVEVDAFFLGQTHPLYLRGMASFTHVVDLGNGEHVDTDTGPGQSFAGAGF